jgi:hypothetical protein
MGQGPRFVVGALPRAAVEGSPVCGGRPPTRGRWQGTRFLLRAPSHQEGWQGLGFVVGRGLLQGPWLVWLHESHRILSAVHIFFKLQEST